jgi:hypothetical protein
MAFVSWAGGAVGDAERTQPEVLRGVMMLAVSYKSVASEPEGTTSLGRCRNAYKKMSPFGLGRDTWGNS